MNRLNFLLNNPVEKFADGLLKKTSLGSIKVKYPSGKIVSYKGNHKGPSAEITLNNFNLFYKLIKKGSVGLAESYINKDFTTQNLSGFLMFAKQNQISFLNTMEANWTYKIFSKLKHKLNKNTKNKSKSNIKYHYDLGNQFYKLWLDDSMTYSSGLFNSYNNSEDLFQAHVNKYKCIADNLKLKYNSTLLEIGCGWGGFSTYAAKNYGTNVNAITISKEQYEYTKKKIFNEGLNEKINVELKDYRDVNEKFDYIASIEMFEAVGKEYWELFFNKIKGSLKENGSAAMQIITINDDKAENYQRNPDFIQQYIFPGGVLPSKTQLRKIATCSNLNLIEYNSFGRSYAKTLQLWNQQFQKSWNQIAKQGFTLKFKRMWEYYFSYCEIGFSTKYTDVSQFLINNKNEA